VGEYRKELFRSAVVAIISASLLGALVYHFVQPEYGVGPVAFALAEERQLSGNYSILEGSDLILKFTFLNGSVATKKYGGEFNATELQRITLSVYGFSNDLYGEDTDTVVRFLVAHLWDRIIHVTLVDRNQEMTDLGTSKSIGGISSWQSGGLGDQKQGHYNVLLDELKSSFDVARKELSSTGYWNAPDYTWSITVNQLGDMLHGSGTAKITFTADINMELKYRFISTSGEDLTGSTPLSWSGTWGTLQLTHEEGKISWVNYNFTSMLALAFNVQTVKVVAEPQATSVIVDPPTVKGTVIGENVTVNINVSNVTDLFAWQAGVTFNPEVLECTGYYEGEFLETKQTWNGTIWLPPWRTPSRWDNTKGVVYPHGCCILCYMDPPDPDVSGLGVNGSGQLGYLTFEVVGTGVSDLHLTDVVLCDSLMVPIPFEVADIFTISLGRVDYSAKTISNLTGLYDPPDPPSSGLFNHTFNPQEKKISFNVITHHDSFYKATIPKAILRSDNLSEWTVEIDDSPVPFVPTENPTHTSLQFAYQNGTHKIEITGTVRAYDSQ